MDPLQGWAGLKILGLFPHPDDEAYAAAGTLSLLAQGGASVLLCFATSGEAGVDLRNPSCRGEELAREREKESVRSCKIMGAQEPILWRLADGGLGDMELAEGVRWVKNLLLAQRPDLLVVLGRDGVYGHVDHLALYRFVMDAVLGLAADEAPRVLEAVFPRGLFAKVFTLHRKVLGGRLLGISDPGLLGRNASEVDLVVDIRSVRQQKLAAVAAHQSQLPGGDPHRFLAQGLIDRLLDEEWFLHSAGPPLPPGSVDPLAGLVPRQSVSP